MRLAREAAYALASLADAPDAPDRCLGNPTTTSTTSCVTTSPARRSRSLSSFARRRVSNGLARVPVTSLSATPTRTVPTSMPSRLPGSHAEPPSASTSGTVLASLRLRPVGRRTRRRRAGHLRGVAAERQPPGLDARRGRGPGPQRRERERHRFGAVLRSLGLSGRALSGRALSGWGLPGWG